MTKKPRKKRKRKAVRPGERLVITDPQAALQKLLNPPKKG